jgi:hypothetical protein
VLATYNQALVVPVAGTECAQPTIRRSRKREKHCIAALQRIKRVEVHPDQKVSLGFDGKEARGGTTVTCYACSKGEGKEGKVEVSECLRTGTFYSKIPCPRSERSRIDLYGYSYLNR